MEGHFEAEQKGAPLILFGLPDMPAGETRYAIAIPKLGSLILTHELNGTVQGPEELAARGLAARADRLLELPGDGRARPADDRDRALQPLAALSRRRSSTRRSSRALVLVMGPSGLLALLAGWFVTEVGRQPFTVYGLLTDGGFRLADRRARRRRLAHRVRARLSRRLRRRHLVSDPAHPRGPGGGDGRSRRRRCAPPASRRSRRMPDRAAGTMSGISDLAIIWGGILAFAIYAYVVLDGFDLGIGMLAPFARDRGGRGDDDRRHRAGLGRQRDLAGARRRRADGGVPARLFGPPAGALRAAHRHAAGADLPRRRLRVPPPATSGTAGWWTLGFVARLLCRDLRARRRARRLHPGHRRRRPRLCRRLVRLADAVQRLHRRRAPLRLRAARRLLPHHEDRGRPAGAHVHAGAAARRRRLRRHRRRQPVDAVHRPGLRDALVLVAEPRAALAGAAARRF